MWFPDLLLPVDPTSQAEQDEFHWIHSRKIPKINQPSDSESRFSPLANTFEFTSTIEAQRRGGWNLRNEASMPDGVFSVTITSTVDIFAAQSHYVPSTGESWMRMGDRIVDDPPPPPTAPQEE